MTRPEKLFQWMKNPRLMTVYFILLVFVFNFLDKPIALYFHQLNLRAYPILSIFDILGRSRIYMYLFLGLGLFFRFFWKNETYEKRSWYLLTLMFIPDALNFAIKITMGRARPELLFLNHEYGFYWFEFNNLHWSFPSGHTTAVIAFTWALASIFPRYFMICLSLAFLAILSRVALFYHYLSDVMAAFYITVLVVGSWVDCFSKQKWFKSLQPRKY